MFYKSKKEIFLSAALSERQRQVLFWLLSLIDRPTTNFRVGLFMFQREKIKFLRVVGFLLFSNLTFFSLTLLSKISNMRQARAQHSVSNSVFSLSFFHILFLQKKLK